MGDDQLQSIVYMNPEDEETPQKRLLSVLSAQNLMNMRGDDSESGGEVGKRAIDQGTTPPSNPTAGNAQGDSAGRMAEAATSGDIRPPGFNESGAQTEFPATASKAAAHTRLQKSESDLEGMREEDRKPRSILRHTLMGMIPMFGPMYTASRMGQQKRQREDLQENKQEYEFESGEEEKQREASMRERLAESTLSVNKGYKDLIARVAAQKANTQENLGEGRNAVSAAGKGYDLNIGPNGTETVTPKKMGDLSEVQRMSMTVQQKSADLKKAQAQAVPEQVELKRKALEVANQHLAAYLQNMSFSQNMQREKQDFAETGPTMQTRNTGQAARPLLDMAPGIKQEVEDFKEHLGPLQSRWKEIWATGVGLAGPQLTQYKKIQDDLEYFSSQMALAHARGRMPLPIFNQFSRMYALAKQDPDNIQAALDVGVKWMTEAQKNAGWDEKLAVPGAPAAGSKLRKQGGARSTPTQNAPPPAANVVHATRDPKTGRIVVQR